MSYEEVKALVKEYLHNNNLSSDPIFDLSDLIMYVWYRAPNLDYKTSARQTSYVVLRLVQEALEG